MGLVLAAGRSRRFRSDKRLHALGDGQPIAIRTLRQWAAALTDNGFAKLYVVTRGAPALDPDYVDPLAPRIAAEALDLTVIPAADSELGMGHSLAAAMTQIPSGPIVVGLADMPYVQPATLKQIVQRLRSAETSAIVRPSYNSQPGNPIGFGAAWHGDLANSTGDAGARRLVKQASQNGSLIDLPVHDRGILQDIDQTSDLNDPPI